MPRPRRRPAICLILVLLLIGATSATAAVGPAFTQGTTTTTTAGGPRPGTSEEFTDGLNSYRVYTPKGYRAGQRLPLYVMLHGCNSTSANQDGNGINAVADREGFVVLYPSHDQYENTDPGTHPLRCWRWYSPADMHRGAGDPETVARQTELVAAKWGTDRTRSYLVGMSSGAMMTSLVAASYPDVYAAIGVVAGCAYGGGAACVSEDYYKTDPSDAQAQAARLEQGPRARLIPVITIHGDADKTVPPAASSDVVRSWLKTANLALSGSTQAPLALTPSSSVTRTPKGRYSYLDEAYRDPQGRLVAQRVLVRGMDHFWPGGVADKAFAPYTDPKGPSGAELTWSFVSRYRLVDGKTVFAAR